MSFGVTDRDPASPTAGFTYRATSPNTMFADRRNIVRPTTWRMLRDIAAFYRDANRFLDAGDGSASLDDFVTEHGYGRDFIELHLLPLGASVWSADPNAFGAFPAMSLFRFLRHHGLLGVGDRPQWRTIVGGSRVYVEALAARFDGSIRTSTPVLRIERPTDPQ